MIITKCNECGKEFTTQRRNRKFCDDCNQKKKHNVQYRIVQCPKCGEEYPKYKVTNGACTKCKEAIRQSKYQFNAECIEEEKKILEEAKEKQKRKTPVPNGHFSQVCKELSEKNMSYAEYQKKKTFEMIGGISANKNI